MTDRDPLHDELEALDDQNDPVAEYEKLMRRQRRPADDALAEFDAMVDRQRGGQRDYGAELDALGDDVGTSSTARQLERTAILFGEAALGSAGTPGATGNRAEPGFLFRQHIQFGSRVPE